MNIFAFHTFFYLTLDAGGNREVGFMFGYKFSSPIAYANLKYHSCMLTRMILRSSSVVPHMKYMDENKNGGRFTKCLEMDAQKSTATQRQQNCSDFYRTTSPNSKNE